MPNVTNQDSNRRLQPKEDELASKIAFKKSHEHLFSSDSEEEIEKILHLLKENESTTDWCAFGHDAESYIIVFKYPYKEARFKTSEELKAIFKERRQRDE